MDDGLHHFRIPAAHKDVLKISGSELGPWSLILGGSVTLICDPCPHTVQLSIDGAVRCLDMCLTEIVEHMPLEGLRGVWAETVRWRLEHG